jgi:hypothetical protein
MARARVEFLDDLHEISAEKPETSNASTEIHSRGSSRRSVSAGTMVGSDAIPTATLAAVPRQESCGVRFFRAPCLYTAAPPGSSKSV